MTDCHNKQGYEPTDCAVLSTMSSLDTACQIHLFTERFKSPSAFVRIYVRICKNTSPCESVRISVGSDSDVPVHLREYMLEVVQKSLCMSKKTCWKRFRGPCAHVLGGACNLCVPHAFPRTCLCTRTFESLTTFIVVTGSQAFVTVLHKTLILV